MESRSNLYAQDYFPFGSVMDGRSFNNEKYRFGYQGSEYDEEVIDGPNSYTTFYRQLDTKLGRWLSLDPKKSKFPWQSPYPSMNNIPTTFNDPQGDDIIGTRKQKRAFRKREKANGTWRGPNGSKRQYKKRLFGKSPRNLILHSKKNDPRVTQDINTATIQGATLRGNNSFGRIDHLYFTPLTKDVETSFEFKIDRSGMTLFCTAPTFSRNYPQRRVGTDLLNKRRQSINQYLNIHSKEIASSSISVDAVYTRLDDYFTLQTRRIFSQYFFNLNGVPWNMGFGGPNGNMLSGTGRHTSSPGTMNLNTTVITVQAIWTAYRNRVDACHGYGIRLKLKTKVYVE